MLALGGIFGTPEMQGVSVLNQQSDDVRQEHLVVSNRMTLERPTGTRGRGDPLWQTELSYRMRPCSIALLHVLEVPAAGGDASAGRRPIGRKPSLAASASTIWTQK